jgi:hypothetical protein
MEASLPLCLTPAKYPIETQLYFFYISMCLCGELAKASIKLYYGLFYEQYRKTDIIDRKSLNVYSKKKTPSCERGFSLH